jgi:nitrogen regulatory protein P-II 1
VKKIEAIIREEKLDEVKEALERSGFPGLTVTQVLGRGQQKGLTLQWRVGEYRVDLLPKVKLEVVANDEQAQEVMDILAEAARTGEIGDGMIFVTTVEQVRRIRTGEQGSATLKSRAPEGS